MHREFFATLAAHRGHRVELVGYGKKDAPLVNVALECLDCSLVIIDMSPEPEAL